MRDRGELNVAGLPYGDSTANKATVNCLEVLLDIRDLLVSLNKHIVQITTPTYVITPSPDGTYEGIDLAERV